MKRWANLHAPPFFYTLIAYESPKITDVGADGNRKDFARRTRLRHILAPLEGAHYIPGRPDRQRCCQSHCRPAPLPRVRRPEERYLLLYQLPRWSCLCRLRDSGHHESYPAQCLDGMRRYGGFNGGDTALRRSERQTIRTSEC